MMQAEEINIGDLLFLSQGIWLRNEENLRLVKRVEEPCLATVVEKNIRDNYKVCIGDEMYLLDVEDAHKYVRDNGN